MKRTALWVCFVVMSFVLGYQIGARFPTFTVTVGPKYMSPGGPTFTSQGGVTETLREGTSDTTTSGAARPNAQRGTMNVQAPVPRATTHPTDLPTGVFSNPVPLGDPGGTLVSPTVGNTPPTSSGFNTLPNPSEFLPR
jgi:hypothetical protein